MNMVTFVWGFVFYKLTVCAVGCSIGHFSITYFK